MEKVLKILTIMTITIHCNGEINLDDLNNLLTRRAFFFDNEDAGTILGIPDGRSKLPPGEPILPGHTLIRPSFGMLKSAVKFPHKDHEDGAGVYGNLRNLGLRYGGYSDRVLYTKFRRMLSDNYGTDAYKPALRLRKIKSNYLPTNIQKGSDEDDDRHYSNELWHSFETPDSAKVYSVIPIKKDKLKALNSNKRMNKFLNWYSQAKELYDHIKFNRDALSFFDLLKEKPEKKQSTLDEYRESFYRTKKNKKNKIYH